MKRFCQKIGVFKRFIRNTLDDWLAAAGSALVSAGVYQIYAPAGYIVIGLFLIAAAVVWSRGMAGDRHDIP